METQQDDPEATLSITEKILYQTLASRTPSLTPMIPQMALAGAHDVPLLLTGETGTGKTFLARLIHGCSPRRMHPFLIVPCGALAGNLIESELFGHVKGAFTGAVQHKEGKFAAAQNGTLLLDEIDALKPHQQIKLLRIVETGEYEAVGKTRTALCQARIIVASNINLEEAVSRGRFRKDLYYRLNVLTFHVPPLRERPGDIGPLVRAMVARFSEKYQKKVVAIDPRMWQVLKTYPWPGNIRQLENVIQCAVISCPGPELLLGHLPDALVAPYCRPSI